MQHKEIARTEVMKVEMNANENINQKGSVMPSNKYQGLKVKQQGYK